MPHEPKKRRPKSASRTRRAAISLNAVRLITCSNCNSKTLMHMACRKCGFYAGKKVGREQVTVTKA